MIFEKEDLTNEDVRPIDLLKGNTDFLLIKKFHEMFWDLGELYFDKNIMAEKIKKLLSVKRKDSKFLDENSEDIINILENVVYYAYEFFESNGPKIADKNDIIRTFINVINIFVNMYNDPSIYLLELSDRIMSTILGISQELRVRA